MSDGEQNPSHDRHLYAGFMRQFDEARRTVAALDTVFRDGNVEAVQGAQRIIRQLADRVQELESTIQESLKVDAPVQPEKEERRPLTEPELRHVLDGTNNMVRNAMRGPFWPELEEACRAIEAAHGISPSPSMVGREGE